MFILNHMMDFKTYLTVLKPIICNAFNSYLTWKLANLKIEYLSHVFTEINKPKIVIFGLKYFCGSTEGSSRQTPFKGSSKWYNGFLYGFFILL